MLTSILVAIIVLVICSSTYLRKTKNYPPGPFRWPVIGNLSLLRKLSRKFGGQHLALLELSRWYGSDVVALRIGATNVIAVSGRKGIQEVLHNEAYDGRPWNEFIRLRNFGTKNGITMADGPEWREARAWVVRKLRLIGLGRRQMSDLMKDELSDILKTVEGEGVHRLNQIIGPAVINVLWTLATGKRFSDKQRLQNFIDLMGRRAQAFDMAGGVLSALPWLRYIAPESSGYNLLLTVNSEIKEFIMKTINEHKKNYSPNKQDDLIDMFLSEMYSGKNSSGNFTDDQLVMILMDLFIAGSNTTTTTLDFLFLNMVLNQDSQERLHAEIDEVVGDARPPNLNDRPRLSYVEAVLAESQRLCLVTPIIGPRRVLHDTNLLGYTILKETTVLVNLWSVHMNPDHYPEPESFRPERFFKNGIYVPDENLVLFGEGKRRCPGEALARGALFLLFVGVMQRYRLLPVPGQEPPTLVRVPGLTISPKPYDVLLTPRGIKSPSFATDQVDSEVRSRT